MRLLSPEEALARVSSWSTIEELGRSPMPMLAVDLRDLDRSFRRDHQDDRLAAALLAGPWVNVGVVGPSLDEAMAPLADAFDVIVGDGTQSTSAVDTDDVNARLVELRSVVEASPQASVELVRLLRLTHRLSIAQALHAESLTYAVLQSGETYRRWLETRPPPAGAEITRAVELERTGSLLRITLSRPHKRNALNITMRDELVEALSLVDLDRSIDGALLVGAGGNFSAGGDLDEFGSTPSAALGHHVRSVRSLSALMARVADRVRVHVHGACVGAGIELPAFSHNVIAHSDATFRLPEIAFGLVPGAGGTVSITRRCGRHRTAWLALTGATIDADHALRWQLIDRIDDAVFENG